MLYVLNGRMFSLTQSARGASLNELQERTLQALKAFREVLRIQTYEMLKMSCPIYNLNSILSYIKKIQCSLFVFIFFSVNYFAVEHFNISNICLQAESEGHFGHHFTFIRELTSDSLQDELVS